ncbi:MAG: methionine synthase [Spirochaetaceae bacterium]|jgi:5-methyltetrahydrofolate--homocysteine methyltransferase|nr:methionine synthase [Spirochaetaceae bacterium]
MNPKEKLLRDLMKEKILFLDGAMGTMIQNKGLAQADYHGKEFKDHPVNLKGNNEMLSLTRPDIIKEIHWAFLEAGADILECNTFNATTVSQGEYGTQDLVYRLNKEGARLAVECAREMTQKTPGKPRFVAGILGPTSKTLSISPKMEDPAYRDISFQDLAASYKDSAAALIEGGVDLLMIETIFDTLNAKAAIYALKQLFDERGESLPIMISGTITDESGRTLSGQTAEAFYLSVAHAEPLSVGFNCALGADKMRPHVAAVSHMAPCGISTHPNAGLPNELGEYDESPQNMARILGEFAQAGEVNIVGGCCGTTPEHLKAIVDKLTPMAPREIPQPKVISNYSGLEPLILRQDSLFLNVGERNNVSGSRKFARLIREKQYDEALEIAREQIDNGANIIDINLDDALLESKEEMSHFIRLLASEPEISKVPFMVDSSKWEVLLEGLRWIQGKAIVNSISLKEGEEELIHRAKELRRFGAAAVVMAFDEKGQADSLERKLEICRKTYKVLTEKAGFPPEDIIFDVNVFAVATGIEEHRDYANAYIQAIEILKKELPHARYSGGISNVSFSFRGNNYIREAMHSVFLYYAVKAGLDMGIVNASQLTVYDDIPEDLRVLIEDVMLNRRPEADDELLEKAGEYAGQGGKDAAKDLSWREGTLEERITHSLVKGIITFLEEDVTEALDVMAPLKIIEELLMAGMNRVGELFGSGKMFLPQVVKSARVMKRAVAQIEPLLEKDAQSSSRGRVVLATVKGDVHDIGKNIVGLVLQCNGYEVFDLGVMVPPEKIIQAARDHDAQVIALSGLITPSLDEMAHMAAEMERLDFHIPLFVGGATTSKMHTALKIHPNYHNPVIHTTDASRVVGMMAKVLNPEHREEFWGNLKEEYKQMVATREAMLKKQQEDLALGQSKGDEHIFSLDWKGYAPPKPQLSQDIFYRELKPSELIPYIDWAYFYKGWGFKGNLKNLEEDSEKGQEAAKVKAHALELIQRLDRENFKVKASAAFRPAHGDGKNRITVEEQGKELNFDFPRQKKGNPRFCLADFIAPKKEGIDDWLGFFACTAGDLTEVYVQRYRKEGDDYNAMLVQLVSDRLAEAAAEWLHYEVRTKLWGYDTEEKLELDRLLKENYRGIRPAPGYSSCPNHEDKKPIIEMLDRGNGLNITLTESFMMVPAASVCGYFFSHPESVYFSV